MAILPQYLSIFPKDNANGGQNKRTSSFYCRVAAYLRFFAKPVSTFSNLVVLCTFNLKTYIINGNNI